MPPKNQPFTKPPLSVPDQIARLQARGMQFSNLPLAGHYLAHLNYYRLTAYWLPFEANHQTHQFRAGTQFDEVLKYYVFDRELRLVVLDAIERIEVSVRTQMTQVLTMQYGSHPLLDPTVFHCPVKYANTLTKLLGEYRRSDETFSDHFRKNYSDKLPPMWAAVELMTLGQISSWFSNIDARQDRKAIAVNYSIDESILSSFLHHLTIIRNICAHHSRLWNRRFTFTIKLPKNHLQLTPNLNTQNRKNLYNTLVFLGYLVDFLSPGNNWKQRIKDLVLNNNVNTEAMGFPTNWQQLPMWK